MTTSSSYSINAPHVVHEVFEDGEAAIINLKTGAYYSLDPIGAAIWGLVDQRCSVGAIVEQLVQRYDGALVQIIDDVNTLMAKLLAEELVSPASEVGAAAEARVAPAAKAPYSSPVFERFEDMKELLLLDPIHEVGEAGWPHAKADES